jgi:hypothetical protein
MQELIAIALHGVQWQDSLNKVLGLKPWRLFKTSQCGVGTNTVTLMYHKIRCYEHSPPPSRVFEELKIRKQHFINHYQPELPCYILFAYLRLLNFVFGVPPAILALE